MTFYNFYSCPEITLKHNVYTLLKIKNNIDLLVPYKKKPFEPTSGKQKKKIKEQIKGKQTDCTFDNTNSLKFKIKYISSPNIN